jgi:hypothetical protein
LSLIFLFQQFSFGVQFNVLYLVCLFTMATHRLQRLSSPSRTVSAFIHLIGILSFSASFRYLTLYPTPVSQSYGGSFQFLTIIGLAGALLTFSIGLLADLTSSSFLFAIKNRLSVCSAPLEVLVSILYWGLCAIDKSLVFPEELALPFLPDFGFHAMPAIMLTIDLLLLSPPWTIRAYPAMVLSMTLAFLYWAWVEYCYSKNGLYVSWRRRCVCPCRLTKHSQISVSYLCTAKHLSADGALQRLCCPHDWQHDGVEVGLWIAQRYRRAQERGQASAQGSVRDVGL